VEKMLGCDGIVFLMSTWSMTAIQLKTDHDAPHVMDITKSIVAGSDTCKRYSIPMKKLVE